MFSVRQFRNVFHRQLVKLAMDTYQSYTRSELMQVVTRTEWLAKDATVALATETVLLTRPEYQRRQHEGEQDWSI